MGWMVTLTVACIALCAISPQGVAQPSTDEIVLESRVISDILINKKDYIREARPATKLNQSVDITVWPYIARIEDIDAKNNLFSATLLLFQSWTDPRLRWNKTDYGGVERVRLPSEKIWLPDIVPYNVGTSDNTDPVYEETVVVSNTGVIIWAPLLTIRTSCGVDVTNFPFDSQTCVMYFGSWVHSEKEVKIVFSHPQLKEIDLPVSLDGSSMAFVSHPQWDLVDGKVKAKILSITYGPENYSVLSLVASAKRKASFYKYLAIGPGAIIGFLVPIMFLLPSKSKEKTTYGMLLVIGLILLITVLSGAIPLNHTSTPRVGMFYLITLVLISFSTILSILVSNISHRGTRRRALPNWIHKACLSRNGLRRLLCIDKYSPVDNLFRETMRELEDHSEPSAHDQPGVPGATEMHNAGKLESQMKDMNKYLRYICGKLSAEDTYKNVNTEWEELATVMDRVLFVIFFILYALTAIGLLT